MRKLILLALVLVCAGTAHAQYSTVFPSPPAPENPIAEGGKWINGRTNGTSWGNVITDSHGAHGEPQAQQSAFADYTAVLSGTWASGQTACGTVYIDPTLTRTTSNYEIELRTNVTVSSGSITGYEFNYSMDNNGNQYWGAVRWNGAVGNFTGFTGFSTPTPLATGDVLCGSHISGTLTFTLTRGGTQLQSQSVPDTQQGGAVYTGGSPGMGFFNGGGPVADNAKFGFSAWSTPTAGGSGGGANTYTASSCQQGDVNEVINGSGGITTPIVPHNAVDGDTIIIPAGSCTWTSSIIVPPNIGISIIGSGTPNASNVCTTASQVGCGAGTINTIITHGGFIMAPTFGKSLSRISLINFQPSSGAGAPITVTGTCAAGGCPNLRLDNLFFPSSWSAQGLSDDAVAVISNMFGVADHNTAGDVAPTVAYLDFINLGNSSWQGLGLFGDQSWSSPLTEGTNQLFYLENNILNYSLGTDTDIPSGTAGGGGARLACRFNYSPAINEFGVCSMHGTDTTGRPRGGLQWEGYYNFGTCSYPWGTQGCGSAWPARSGTGISFGNNFASGSGAARFYGLTSADPERRWRPDTYGACDGGPSYSGTGTSFDTVDGPSNVATIYYSGTIGSVTTLSNGYVITDSNASPGWTTNQWVSYGTPYSVFETVKGGAEIQLQSGNTITVFNGAPGSGFVPAAGDAYQIRRAFACIDQAARSNGALLTGSSTAPVLNSTGLPGPVNQVISPIYEADDTLPSNAGTIGSTTMSIILGRDFYAEATNQIAQTNSTTPFNGALVVQPLTSWTTSSNNCTLNMASTTGLGPADGNHYVIVVDAAPGAHLNGGVPVTPDGFWVITGITATSVTVGNGCGFGFGDGAGAGGSANGVPVGHGPLALRPTTCSTGVAYLATDQGTWNTIDNTREGELFTCTSTNTWSLTYTPYTYPHPLVTQASPSPAVTFSPLSLNFGTVIVGQTSSLQTITITNTGTANLVFGPTGTSSPAGASFNPVAGGNCPISGTLTPGSNCTQNVQVTANIAGGPYSGTFNFPSNAPGSPQTVPLSVTATSPSITFSPASLVLGTLPLYVTSSPMQATVKNTGTVSITISSVTASGIFAMAAPTVAPDCRTIGTLGAGASCNFAVMATPAVAGLVSGSIIFTDTASGSPQSFPVSVTGLAVAPAPVPSFAMAVNLAGCKPASPPATTFCFTEDGHIYLSTCAATCSPFQPFGLTVSGTAQ